MQDTEVVDTPTYTTQKAFVGENPMSVKEAIIIGCGSMGERHARNLEKFGMKIVAYADPLAPPGPMMYRDSLECIHKESNERLVVVSSPTHLHAEHAIEAIYSGARCLYIEKPVTVNEADSIHLREAALNNNIKIVVGYNFRYHRGLNNLIDSTMLPNCWLGALGIDDISTWPSYKKFGRDSYLFSETGGVLWTSASHAVDIAINIQGEVGAVMAAKVGTDAGVMLRIHHIGGGISVLFNKWEEGHSPASLITYYSPADSIVADLLPTQPTDMHEQLMYHALEYFNKNILDPKLPMLATAIHGVQVLVAAEESLETGEGVTL